jgi:ankyrin repeat protein
MVRKLSKLKFSFFFTNLYFVAIQSSKTDIVSILINNGSNVNWKDNNGLTPIIYGTPFKNWYSELILNFKLASQNGNNETVRLLLQNGALIDSPDIFGQTALYYGENIV